MTDLITRLESWVKPPTEHFLPHLRTDIREAIAEIKRLRHVQAQVLTLVDLLDANERVLDLNVPLAFRELRKTIPISEDNL